ncbi:LuxR family transcriptional regulator [Massilia eurypsychrophila]|jgi:LuxR family quorum-sensing system transcriptional regulator SolR|uniref:LuxR family transcriptional regulator n=1 Tax=Massilia eurypsychrophila TaxID=1485217 RepID=A0A2G8T8E6_9BURK|nr:autoinducer binding domain-containing protein [Massilia eurypsychrophila]PIL42325.1 LuxR family transcriptional regulator [Massilia eurypsychrophila]
MLHHQIVDWQESTSASFAAAKTQAEFLDVLKNAALDVGFEYCALGLLFPLPFTKPQMFMMNNYSAAWRQRYVDGDYLRVDPTVAHARTSSKPVIWSDSVFATAPAMWDDARDHKLHVGWAQPTHDKKGVAGLFTLARGGGPISAGELRGNVIRMTWLAQAAHEVLAQLVDSRPNAAPQVDLTEREREVLRWTADGKTSGEIGDILNVAERTVNFHVNNAMAKLGTSNKTATVLRAAMLRLL